MTWTVVRWQFKWRGLWWCLQFAEWSEWPGELRRAWWFNWPQRGKNGRYNIGCYRVCGVTLFGRKIPWKTYRTNSTTR